MSSWRVLRALESEVGVCHLSIRNDFPVFEIPFRVSRKISGSLVTWAEADDDVPSSAARVGTGAPISCVLTGLNSLLKKLLRDPIAASRTRSLLAHLFELCLQHNISLR